jgi:uncharacterized protein (DUF362 family)
MDQAVKVALVRSDNRRGALAQALSLIAPEIRARIAGEVLLKPNLVSHRVQLPSTHADAFSATLDALFAAGASRVTVAEGATDATAGFERFGFRREAFGRPVRFFDLNRQETAWVPLELQGVNGARLQARVSASVAGSACRISLALAKTHVTAILTLSLKNMLSSIHPDDRVMMHGHASGNGYTGWKRPVVEWLKGESWLVCRLTRLMGRVRAIQADLAGKSGLEGWRRLSEADRRFLLSVEAMNRNLVALCTLVKPHVSVVDGFLAMEGEGPRHGRAIRLGTAIAGTDAVAVDAVAAAVMGFDPLEIGYLHYLQEAGMGVANLDAITVVGDPIERVRKRCARHSNHGVQRHWRSFTHTLAPERLGHAPHTTGPHVRPAPAGEVHAS